MDAKKITKFIQAGDRVGIHVMTLSMAILSLYALSFFKKDFRSFFNQLGFDIYLDPQVFIILTGILLLFIFIKTNANQLHLKKLKAVLLIKKINTYFVIALYFSLTLTYYGYYFLTINYGTSLPIDNWPMSSTISQEAFKISINSFESFPKLDCKSLTGKKDFVLNDEVICSISFSHVENPSHPITNTYVEGKIPNEGDQVMYYRDHYGSGPINFVLDINSTEIFKIYFGVGVSNNTRFGDNVGTHELTINTEVLTTEEYRSKNDKKISLFITLLSIVTFAVFGTMNSIKNLLKK